MSKYTVENHNLDGNGERKTHVYTMPPSASDYWQSVTDVTCPVCESGTIRWAENGYVPGYRICDRCGRHFLAGGNNDHPTLLRVGARKGGWLARRLRSAAA